MAQTMISIVNQLKSQGNTITYTKRSDGGIRITSINGIKYKASTGNAIARQLAGTTLSERRSKQLARIAKQRKRVEAFSQEEEKLIREAQRALRKYGKHGETVKRATYRQYRAKYGIEKAMQALRNDILWTKGLAYKGQGEALAQRLIRAGTLSDNPELFEQLAEIIQKRADGQLKQTEVVDIYELIYQYQEGTISEYKFISEFKKVLFSKDKR